MQNFNIKSFICLMTRELSRTELTEKLNKQKTNNNKNPRLIHPIQLHHRQELETIQILLGDNKKWALCHVHGEKLVLSARNVHPSKFPMQLI